MTELKLKNYYSRVLKNFQSDAIFYRYFNQKKRYKETLNLLIKIITFIKKNSDLGGGSSTMGTLSGGNKEIITVGENCLLGANSGIGISLGDNCTVEAGLYVTAGTRITLLNENDKIVKALELNGKNNMLYFRDSVSGKVCAKNKEDKFKLNQALHENN